MQSTGNNATVMFSNTEREMYLNMKNEFAENTTTDLSRLIRNRRKRRSIY